MTWKVCMMSVVGFGLALTEPLLAQTEVGGFIREDTLWTKRKSPYRAVNSVIVVNGATLTIEPGVEIRFTKDKSLNIGDISEGAGALVALGGEKESQRIRFTSDEQKQPGDWAGIEFSDLAIDAAFDEEGNYVSGSVLRYVIVEFAGGVGRPAALNIKKSSPFIVNSQVQQSATRGINVDATDAPPIRIEFCQISDCKTTGSGGGISVGVSGVA